MQQIRAKMDLVDLNEGTIDAKVLDALGVKLENMQLVHGTSNPSALRETVKDLPSLRMTLVVWRRSNSCRRQCSTPSTTQRSSSSMVYRRRRVYCSMVPLVLMRPCFLGPPRTSATPTSSVSRSVFKYLTLYELSLTVLSRVLNSSR
jgi:hypothetical protein